VDPIINRYSAGSFDGMTDSYNYEHCAWTDAFGDAKYVHSHRDYSARAIAGAIRTVYTRYAGNLEAIAMPSAEDFNKGRLWNDRRAVPQHRAAGAHQCGALPPHLGDRAHRRSAEMSALHTCAKPLYPIISAPPPATSCQRWRERVAKRRGPPARCSARAAEAVAIDEATAKAFVTRHHYSASYPAARFRVGMMWRPSSGRECLAGVVVFSVPMNERTVPRYFDELAPAAGVELGRLVLLDEVPANAESWLVARAFGCCGPPCPRCAACVSYSDPLERISSTGHDREASWPRGNRVFRRSTRPTAAARARGRC
jgi:hypothetical protein